MCSDGLHVQRVECLQPSHSARLPLSYSQRVPSTAFMAGARICVMPRPTRLKALLRCLPVTTSAAPAHPTPPGLQVPSDNCVFNEKPDMKAAEITASAVAALRSGKWKMVRVNYANPDMVGHTGAARAEGWGALCVVWWGGGGGD